ncbi:MAG: hypothetical protein IJO73_03670 [Clostridia bacterium]|nr:hypothetical protein [Clostridia bacterium]
MKRFRFFSEDKTVYALLLFFIIIFSDVLACAAGFGGASFMMLALAYGNELDMLMYSTYESLIIGSFALCGILLTALYAYRTNQPKKLKAIAAAHIIMSLLPFAMNSLYFPVPDMLLNVIHKITGWELYFFYYGLTYFLQELVSVPVCIFCFVLLSKMKKKGEEGAESVPFRCTAVITVTAFLLVTVAGLGICNLPVSEAYNTSGTVKVAERMKKVIDGALLKDRAERLFESITGETDFSQADALLREAGFIPHTEIKEYIEEQEQVELLIDNLDELMKDEGTLAYTKPDDGYISFSKCILLLPDENGKIKKKIITYVTDLPEKIDEAEESFRELKIGEEKEMVLKKLKKVTDISSYSVEYGEKAVREVYEVSAFNDTSFLHLIETEWFDGRVAFENGILTAGECIRTLDSNAESDEVETFEEKYIIGE